MPISVGESFWSGGENIGGQSEPQHHQPQVPFIVSYHDFFWDNDIKSFTIVLVLALWKPQNHSTPALDATGECLDKTFRQLKARILRSWSWRLEKFLGGHILAQELGQPARCSRDKRKTNRKSKSEHLIMETQTHVKVSWASLKVIFLRYEFEKRLRPVLSKLVNKSLSLGKIEGFDPKDLF